MRHSRTASQDDDDDDDEMPPLAEADGDEDSVGIAIQTY